MTPIVQGRRLTFATYGLYQGLSLLADFETQSYWDHITGECLKGTYLGEQMESGPLLHTRAELVLKENPETQIAISKLSWRRDRMARIMRFAVKRNWLPSFLKKQFERTDERLDPLEMGLGIWRGKHAKFYPERILEAGEIKETWQGIELVVRIHPDSKIPVAETVGEMNREILQVHSLWYGFSATFPQAEIHKGEE